MLHRQPELTPFVLKRVSQLIFFVKNLISKKAISDYFLS
ncbi:hypothetical protein BN1221_03128 [Brenneria goodwinii]|uniref:Uncharacterized protein n=1 Tax=Brenneria goodwinii TaxID=1109412 RepID=A0A0G4JXH4_9GAMM|nr:hypothetical protein BN1221_03128 [Brenneria goodwinii]